MSYVQGFVIPVATHKKQLYRELAAKVASFFHEYGAIHIVETWGDDVPDGKLTDFKKSVAAKPDETVVFSWIVWPDKKTYLEAQQKMQTDQRMQPDGEMPFDGSRMIYAGFEPLFESQRPT